MKLRKKRLYLLVRMISGQPWIEGLATDLPIPTNLEIKAFNVHYQSSHYDRLALKVPRRIKRRPRPDYTIPDVAPSPKKVFEKPHKPIKIQMKVKVYD